MARMGQAHISSYRIVAEIYNQIVGWAALSPVFKRACYAGVAEVSIYIDEKNRGLNIGTILLEYLIHKSAKEGFWTLNAGIFPENITCL